MGLPARFSQVKLGRPPVDRFSTVPHHRERRRRFHQHQVPLLAVCRYRQIVRVEARPERGQPLHGEFVHEAEGGRGEARAGVVPVSVLTFYTYRGSMGRGPRVAWRPE